MRPTTHLNLIAMQPLLHLSNMLMSNFPAGIPGEYSLNVARFSTDEPRSFGSVDTRMPASYSGPYGVLLDEPKSQVLSIATDSANHCVIIQPLG